METDWHHQKKAITTDQPNRSREEGSREGEKQKLKAKPRGKATGKLTAKQSRGK